MLMREDTFCVYMNEKFSTFTLFVDVMFNLMTFSRVLATVIKTFCCRINALYVECKILS